MNFNGSQVFIEVPITPEVINVIIQEIIESQGS